MRASTTSDVTSSGHHDTQSRLPSLWEDSFYIITTMAILKQAAVCAVVIAVVVQACVREHDPLTRQSLVRRQDAVTFPPILDEKESILINSFDNTTLDTWSYFYTHGLHVAGTNKTMAQWTADRWNENGFIANLAEYCTIGHPAHCTKPTS